MEDLSRTWDELVRASSSAPARLEPAAHMALNSLPITWEPHPPPEAWPWACGNPPQVWHRSQKNSTITHTTKSRDAALGTALIPVGPLYKDHYLRFRVVSTQDFDSTGCRGTIGVTDGSAHFSARNGGRAWGVELLDGGWRCCSNAFKSAEERGTLVPAPDAGDVVTLRIECQRRILSVAVGESSFAQMPVQLPEDVTSLRPWAVSAFAHDAFRLLSVAVSPRVSWEPSLHALFPAAAREYALSALVVGYQLASQRLPDHAQEPFCRLWVMSVLPALVDTWAARLEAMGLS